MTHDKFRRTVHSYYKRCGRDLPWRHTRDSYAIIVSEIMLQQTQVSRVIPKYMQFLARFPSLQALAGASLPSVLRVWQGLGYNRRALLLHRLAKAVMERYGGKIPSDRAALRGLPGIGPATSGSVCAFAFNKPEVFIETNIRSVFIHHFFEKSRTVKDSRIIPLIGKTMDTRNPRVWYSALMDYGVYLKNAYPNPSRRSSHFVRQSAFCGSDRQARGQIMRYLILHKCTTQRIVRQALGLSKDKVERVVKSMQKDGLLAIKDGALCLPV